MSSNVLPVPQNGNPRLQYNPLTTYCKQNELSRTREDLCYIERRNKDSQKPFKWNTFHHHPYGSEVQATCYPGQSYWDGYGIPGANIDDESKATRRPGFEATNLNIHQELPTLPINMPRHRGYFNSDIESNLRWEANFDKKECTGVTEKSFMPVTFQVFDGLCFNPQDPQYIVPEDSFNQCYKNGRFYHWGGEDSRHDRQSKYYNACDRSRSMAANLSYSNFGY